MPSDLDDRITEEMRVTGFSRNDLVVEYLLLGMMMYHIEAKGTF